MPPFDLFLKSFYFDPVAAAMIAAGGGAYLAGLVKAHRAGIRWPWQRTLLFYAAGLGSFAWVNFGFLGAYSTQLRWVFATRMALLILPVPSVLCLGKPVVLARATMQGKPLRVLNAILASKPVQWLGNAILGPVLTIVAFSMLITPMVGQLRQSPVANGVLTLVVPIVGVLMALPLLDSSFTRTTLAIAAEFFISLAVLFLDTIPGILLRVNETVLDGITRIPPDAPLWWPSAFHDQHLAGDWLWLIFEFTDLPILAALIIRWIRSDRADAQKMDDLSDEEMEALTQEHLHHRY